MSVGGATTGGWGMLDIWGLVVVRGEVSEKFKVNKA